MARSFCSLWRQALIASLLVGGWVGSQAAKGTEPKEDGLNELVIYQPGTHAEGLPAVRFKDKEGEEGLKVEIRPTVHVHRYYYSGNKEYQGPHLAGGPTIVAAKSPYTNQMMYIDVMLPAGAPVIAYDDDSISYIYPDRRVRLSFRRFHKDKVSVRHLEGQGLGRKVHQQGARLAASVKSDKGQSRLGSTVKTGTRGAGQVFVGVREVLGGVTDATLQTAGKLIAMVPGVKPLQSLAQSAKERKYHDSVKTAAARNERRAEAFVRTVR